MKKCLFTLLFLPGFSVIPAAAQIMSNPAQWYINNQIYSTRVFNGVVANSMLRKSSDGKTNRQNQTKSPNKTAADYSVFKATPNNSLPKQLSGKSSNKAETEQALNSFVSLYQQTAQKDGFPSNDLAYAFEYFVVNNYQIYHDLVDLPADKDPRAKRAKDGFERIQILNQKKLLQVSINQERAIYRQFKEMLASNAEIQKMTELQKQEASELLAIMFGVNFAGYMKGINDGDGQLTEQARQLAKEGL
ncbi:MAG TPA: DUF6683 family protein, partial [Pyrinomonadaceae bacterium]|nr:DUF6683 family protein [Pyrinomonadaceae bacterium]